MKRMRKLYEKNEVLFAVLWIVVYCILTVPVRGKYGDGSIWMFIVLLAIAAGITLFVKVNHLEEKYGLTAWPKNTKRYLWFIPMWILVTGNLWDGISLAYKGSSLLLATLSMMLIGYVEEMLFRGFLFRAMLPKDGVVVSVIVSSVTFGIGHIVNMFTGQASPETFIQVLFAISWGFVFTMVYYRCGSLWPCIVAHALVDVFSVYGADSVKGDWAYIIATIVIGTAYSIYLAKLGKQEENRNE